MLKDKDYASARTETHYVLNELFGVSESMILALREEDVLDLVFRGGPAEPQRIAVLADILRINGEIAASEGNPDEAAQWYRASIRYVVTAAEKMGLQPSPEALRALETGVHTLLPGALDADLLASLYALYRGVGNHAIASELIAAFAEKTHHEPGGVEEARADLVELSRMGEDALRQCGMSRERVAGMLVALSSTAT